MDGDFNSASRYRRKDYTSEPIHTKESRLTPQKSKKKSSRKKHIFILIFVAVVGLGVAGGLLIGDPASPIKKDLKKAQPEVAFPIYFPARLPSGYAYKKDSVKFTDGVLLFYLESGTKKIIFTIQPKPANFNFDNFNKKTLVDSKEIITPIGQAVTGTLGDKAVGSVVTEKDWILVSAPLDISDDDLTATIKNLQQLQ